MTESRKLMSQPSTKPKQPAKRDVLSAPRDSFNLLEWAQGITQITRAVTIYDDLGLYGQREKVGEQLRTARLIGEDSTVEELQAEVRDLTQRMLAGSLTITLRGVTQSRFQEILEEAKRYSANQDEQTYYRICAQIVEPEGFNVEVMKALDERSPLQGQKIGTVWAQMNQTVPDIATTAPF